MLTAQNRKKLIVNIRRSIVSVFDGASEVKSAALRSIPFVLAGTFSALVCVAYAQIFKIVEELAISHVLNSGWMIMLTTPLCFLAAWALVELLAPTAAGSGIPQVLAAIAHGVDTHANQKLISVRAAFVKIASSTVLVLGGGAVGREGPSIQISAAIFDQVRRYWARIGQSPPTYRGMLVAGGAGGLAAAFNTPLGGVIYAVEELAKDHLSNFRLGLLEAVITAGLIAQLLMGSYLYLGFPPVPIFRGSFLGAVVVISLVAGFSGAAFGRLILSALRRRRSLNIRGRAALAIIMGLIMGAMIMRFGSLSVASGREIVDKILFEGGSTSIWDCLTRFIGPILSSTSGAAGGIFAPSLAAGAAIGNLVSQFFSAPVGNIGVLCGMIAFLTGVTRAPVTSFVLILEMTDRHSAIFPMMLSGVIGLIIARTVDQKSYYEKAAELFYTTKEPAPTSEK